MAAGGGSPVANSDTYSSGRRAMTRPRLSAARREALAAHAFLSPWTLGFLGLTLLPMLATFVLSFTDYALLDPGRARWVGLANYRQALGDDPLVWQALKVTAYYACASLALDLVVGFALALVLRVGFRGVGLVRAAYYLPGVVSGVAVALLWLWIFQPRSGLANAVLGVLGVPRLGWFYSTSWVIPAFVLMSLWNVGRSAFIYLAILQRIPARLYEAAAVDGASPARRFLSITLPLVTPAIFLNLVLGLIGNFQIFTPGFVITEGNGGPGSATLGGPGTSSLFYILYLYQQAFRYFSFGYAAALACILFVLLLAITLIAFGTARYWVHYDTDTAG